MATWLDRVKNCLGARGYENCMRRSLQSIVLYEAKRCVDPQLHNLRPFQRKLAMMDQIYALVHSLDFLYPHQRQEILWRTATSKEPISPEIAWKRQQLITKELKKLSEQILPFLSPERTHEESVDLLEQNLFETGGDNQGKSNQGKSVPVNWSHAHNHCLMTFRIYFKGADPDPLFPKPEIRDFAILTQGSQGSFPPPGGGMVETAAALSAAAAPVMHNNKVAAAAAANMPLPNEMSTATSGGGGGARKSQLIMAELSVANSNSNNFSSLPNNSPIDQRRKLLSEVREHLDLLKEFEGVISEEELAERKRQLFLALPPAPPPASSASKRARNM